MSFGSGDVGLTLGKRSSRALSRSHRTKEILVMMRTWKVLSAKLHSWPWKTAAVTMTRGARAF